MMQTFYNVRVEGTLKWIFGEGEEDAALDTFYWLKLDKHKRGVTLERIETDELGTITRMFKYEIKHEAWMEEPEGGKRNGGVLHGKKKRTTRGHVRRER
ncbi:MAG: hypothetical protein E6102_03035 [Negativicoccus succinicivorans]|uniref:hypothetical protein n=1 Tax=Negativicoccus succinicivorans TaxID=620903 RepID=UPI00290843C1|nr:hypothetical protein [Negativicoccus succinicivorans]MDU5395723.1 hypothetical protein [Negativicoccus succinicivorans]